MSKTKIETTLKHLKIPNYLIEKAEEKYKGNNFTQIVITALTNYLEGK